MTGRPWSPADDAKLRAAARKGPIKPATQRRRAVELERSIGAVAVRACMRSLLARRRPGGSRQRASPVDREEPPILDAGGFAARMREVAARGRERPPGFESIAGLERAALCVSTCSACKNVV
jgi:hypothetical protein